MLSHLTNLRHFETEIICINDTSKFNKNVRESYKRLENIVGKGEIAFVFKDLYSRQLKTWVCVVRV